MQPVYETEARIARSKQKMTSAGTSQMSHQVLAQTEKEDEDEDEGEQEQEEEGMF